MDQTGFRYFIIGAVIIIITVINAFGRKREDKTLWDSASNIVLGICGQILIWSWLL